MSAEYKAHEQHGLLLNANECSNNLNPVIYQEFLNGLETMAFSRYPEDTCKELRDAYAKLCHISPDQIIVGNGSDQMLQLLINTLVGVNGTLLTLDPDFGMYDFYADTVEANVIKLCTGFDGMWSVEQMADMVKNCYPDLVLFSNPNNPTGFMLGSKNICALADAIAPIPLAVDEAYMEFGQDSVLEHLDEHPNLYITRTLSKAWGIASARIGFLISSKENIKALLPHKIVYSNSSITQLLGTCVLNHPEIKDEYVDLVVSERGRIEGLLKEWNVVYAPSKSNFVSFQSKDPKALIEALEKENIQLRTWPDENRIRMTIGLPQENDRALEVIERMERA